jgi:hypothetical protein
MTSTLVFPAGTFLRLRSGLRTQAAVRLEDLTPEDLASLDVVVNGARLSAQQITFSRLAWDSSGQLIAQMVLTNLPPTTNATITVSNASGSVALKAMIDASSSALATIDVRSTARALIVEAMRAKGRDSTPEEVDDRAVTVVANKLSSLMQSSLQTAVLTNQATITLVTATAGILVLNGPATLDQSLAQLERSSAPGGGGAGGNGGPGAPGPTTSVSLTTTTVPFAIPQILAMVSTGTTLYAGGHGFDLRRSTDNGDTWTVVQAGLQGKAVTLSGGTLFGVDFAGSRIWSMPATGGTVTPIDTAGLPNLDCRALLALGGNLYFANQTDKVIYVKSLAGGNWTPFGNDLPPGQVDGMVTDGTNIYVITVISPNSADDSVYRLAAATPGGTWTKLVGGDTGVHATMSGSLAYQGGLLYATRGDKVYVWDPNTSLWSVETVDAAASMSLCSLWVDGTDLVVATRQNLSATINGINQYGLAGSTYRRPINSPGNWSAVGDSFSARGSAPNVLNCVAHNGYWFVGPQRKAPSSNAWTVRMPDIGRLSRRSVVTAGGCLWAVADNHVYRFDPGTGTWDGADTGLPPGWLGDEYGRLHAAGDKVYLHMRSQVYELDATDSPPAWTPLGPVIPVFEEDLTSDETNLYVLGVDLQVYALPKSGVGAWTAYGPSDSHLNLGSRDFHALNGTLYAVGNGTVYTLPNAGGTWTALPPTAGYTITDVVLTAARILAIGDVSDGQAGVRQWNGSAWVPMVGYPNSGGLITLGDAFYASGYNGLYRLGLGASTWIQLSNTSCATHALVFESTSGKVYVTPQAGGLARTN